MTEEHYQAGKEISRLATLYGLTDLYADAPLARRGEYVGVVNGQQISCTVFDIDPVADLAALRSAIAKVGA